MKFSVCIDMMFQYVPFLDRFCEVKSCGIDTVEFWKWSNKDIPAVENMLRKFQMKVSLFNIDSTDGALSYDLSRGILNAGRKGDFLRALNETIPVLHKIGTKKLIVLSGEYIKGFSKEQQLDNIVECLSAAAPIAENEDITLLLEPLNTFDRKGYFPAYSELAFSVLKRIGSPHIKLLYDIYHAQRMEGNLIHTISENIDKIGHFHVADSPGRHEPGTGEINYKNVLSTIAKLPYDGYVGLEYRATKTDNETFSFLKEV